MDCSPPGSFVHGTFQSGILEWIAFPLYIYISPMDYYSAIRKSEKMNVATYPFVATWKDLEVILREVS